MSKDTTTIDNTHEQLIELLKRHDINATSQRVEIANILLTKPQHMSADQVIAKARECATYISKATVYNTLNLFAEKGLLREVTIESGKIFFDSNTSAHHHIFNEDTGELTDIEQGDVTIAEMPSLPQNTVTTGIDVIVRVKNC